MGNHARVARPLCRERATMFQRYNSFHELYDPEDKVFIRIAVLSHCSLSAMLQLPFQEL